MRLQPLHLPADLQLRRLQLPADLRLRSGLRLR
jgi:hypothetical protein